MSEDKKKKLVWKVILVVAFVLFGLKWYGNYQESLRKEAQIQSIRNMWKVPGGTPKSKDGVGEASKEAPQSKYTADEERKALYKKMFH